MDSRFFKLSKNVFKMFFFKKKKKKLLKALKYSRIPILLNWINFTIVVGLTFYFRNPNLSLIGICIL